MTGLWIAALLGLSAVLLLPRSRLPAPPARRTGTPGGRPVHTGGPDAVPGRPDLRRNLRRDRRRSFLARFVPGRQEPLAQEVPLVIHQLTGLLTAGRAPHQLWADAAALQAASLQAAREQPERGTAAAGGTLSAQLLPVLEAAARAASLGLSPVPVFRAAAETGSGRHAEVLGGLWMELAACVSVSERSGAPLAGVLDRYAAQLEAGLDNQAARDTALAGPQATVRLLSWLPVGGLGLGYLLGADPVGILLGSPAGWLAAAAGIALSLAGRVWSTALVRRAAGP